MIAGMKLQRVDSPLVAEVSNRVEEGLRWVNGKKKGKMLKYTINYDGMYGSLARTHSEDRYANESPALPENMLEHFKKSKDHSNVYLFDREHSSTKAFSEMRSREGLFFIGRLMENRKLHVVRELDLTFKPFGDSNLRQDAVVQLYGYSYGTG
jgi:hypothetical protein